MSPPSLTMIGYVSCGVKALRAIIRHIRNLNKLILNGWHTWTYPCAFDNA